MEFIKALGKGQKEFFLDLLSPIYFILLALGYVIGVGLARILFIFFYKKSQFHSDSYWKPTASPKKDPVTFLDQF